MKKIILFLSLAALFMALGAIAKLENADPLISKALLIGGMGCGLLFLFFLSVFLLRKSGIADNKQKP